MSDNEYADDLTDDAESGGTLRRKLEEALSLNKELTAQVASFKATQVISDQGFDLVKPEDLQGVPLEEVEARAQALQEERVGVAQRFLSERLGVAADQVEGLLAGDPAGREAFDRIRQTTAVTGEPVRDNPLDGVTPGVGRLRAAFAAKTKT